ncbi:MAG: inorganic phosphate transporter [Thiobacillus sp.]|nr:inorganic phosphate transporter [Thiobacillus sp.]
MPTSSSESNTRPASAPAPLARLGLVVRLAAGLLFLAAVYAYLAAGGQGQAAPLLLAAALLGAYMAMTIGANDVANNVGPAVGARALPLPVALAIAAAFEVAGALIAGGDVVETIRSDILDQGQIASGAPFVWLMLAALLAAALCIHIATAIGAPVSTTHAIVGAVLGAGLAASGPEAANWTTLVAITASWLVSPFLGGAVAAAILYLIKRTITYQTDMVAAARRIVPMLVALMAWSFSTYLILKGLDRVWRVDFPTAALIGLVVAIVSYLIVGPVVVNRPLVGETPKERVNQLFVTPLLFAAALLSFAHGANDVANAVGPLAAISDEISLHDAPLGQVAAVPFWTLLVGALGIAVGLALYGPRVIRTIGSEITELDPMRAYSVALSVAVTVILASQLGLPVSTTHIVVGGVFGVGFLREYLKAQHARMMDEIHLRHAHAEAEAIDAFMARFRAATLAERGRLLGELKGPVKKELKGLRKRYRRDLVKRAQVLRIAAAWLVTVPAAALMAALFYYMLRGMLLP